MTKKQVAIDNRLIYNQLKQNTSWLLESKLQSLPES